MTACASTGCASATSTRTRAARAGVAKQTLYNHFASKDDLFSEVARLASSRIAVSLEGGPTDVRECLLRFAATLRAKLLSDEGLAMFRVLVAEAVRFPALAKAFYEKGPQETARRLAVSLERAMAAGQLRRDDPGFAAEMLIGMLVGQAQGIAESLANSPLLDRLSTLTIAGFQLGPELAGIGRSLINWLGTNAIGFIGTATHFTLNLLLSFFGLYYLLLSQGKGWENLRSYVPFSERNAEKLRERFRDVTLATVLGTGVTALLSGIMIGGGFWLVGLSNALFWGVITIIFAILPVLGSGIVWIPGAISLAIGGRVAAAIVLTAIGVVAGYVGTPIHSYVVGRYTSIHPMITLVGAIAGISYFGLLGILIGPLVLSYFFELIRMYREEYVIT